MTVDRARLDRRTARFMQSRRAASAARARPIKVRKQRVFGGFRPSLPPSSPPLNRDLDIYGIRAVESCRARQRHVAAAGRVLIAEIGAADRPERAKYQRAANPR
jgi:hypothetical protein